jgi:putative ABC transport system ATP-binding protein
MNGHTHTHTNTAATSPIVVAEALRLNYGQGAVAVPALNGVSLAVERGEVVLILGPSGSGKTTLLQVLGALLRPTSGSVRIDGTTIETLSEKARRELRLAYFGFVFQAHHLIPTLTAWENVALALDLKGVRGRPAEARSRALLDELGLGARANAYPAQMSGGQRQRVAVARACALDAPIILADEPTASLDSAAGWQVIQLLGELARERGRAVIIVTHDNRLRVAADRAIAIEDGRIVDEPVSAAEQSARTIVAGGVH